MCDRIISDDSFSIKYVSDQYETQQMCDKAVDDCIAALKIVSDWFVTSKRIKILFTALYADENILYFSEDSSNVVFNCNGMGILNIGLNNINLDDTNYDEHDSDTIILIRFLAWHIKFKKCKELKKNISKVGGIGACQKMGKKKLNRFLLGNISNVHSMRVFCEYPVT